ncbi:MAG: SPOR domain-containing protein [Proteobacteria bacterium]|nr:SPOR domain-containing protein [Pseudomonadota bacterium]
MAVKRGKKQARRKDEPMVPGYVWLLAGLLIGGAVAVALWLRNPHAVDGLLPHPNPTAKAKASASGSSDVPEGNPPSASASSAASPAASAAAASPAAPKKPKYDFYTLLPEREVVIPDDELNAQVKAETAAANLAAKQQAALAAGVASTASPATATAVAANPASSNPAASNGASAKPAAAGTATTANPAIADTAATKPASSQIASSAHPATTTTAATATIPVPASQLKSGQYLLQAGAFKNTQQADDLKARIAMLGLVGRVETVETPAGTMHRVRLGPYATASELEAAKQKLSGGGLPAVAIRVK